MNLEEIRKAIDELDCQLLEILAERLILAKRAADRKQKVGLPIKDAKREKEIMEKIKTKSKKLRLNHHFTQKLFREILKESKYVQKFKQHK